MREFRPFLKCFLFTYPILYSENPINYKHFQFSSYSISFKSYGVLKLCEKGHLRDKTGQALNDKYILLDIDIQNMMIHEG